MAASPVTSEDFLPQVPAQPLCETFREKLLNNDKMAEFLEWLVDSDGNLATGFLENLNKYLFKVGFLRWAPVVEADNNPETGQVWLECNNASLLQADYPKLFTYLGIQFNQVGDNPLTAFRTPKLNGRVLMGRGDSETLGSSDHAVGTVVGAEEVLTPEHTHTTGRFEGTTGDKADDWVGLRGSSTATGLGQVCNGASASVEEVDLGTADGNYTKSAGINENEDETEDVNKLKASVVQPSQVGLYYIFAGFKVSGEWL